MAAFHVRQANLVTDYYISNGLWFAGSFIVSTVAQKITRFLACVNTACQELLSMSPVMSTVFFLYVT